MSPQSVSETPSTGPLAGIRVVELGMWVAGPGNANGKDVALLFDNNGASHELRSVRDGVMSTVQLDKTKHSEHLPVETITGQ